MISFFLKYVICKIFLFFGKRCRQFCSYSWSLLVLVCVCLCMCVCVCVSMYVCVCVFVCVFFFWCYATCIIFFSTSLLIFSNDSNDLFSFFHYFYLFIGMWWRHTKRKHLNYSTHWWMMLEEMLFILFSFINQHLTHNHNHFSKYVTRVNKNKKYIIIT